MVRRCGGAGKKVLAASADARYLALAAKHLHILPYELWHLGREDLPPHPRPKLYRALLYAMAAELEENAIETASMSASGTLAAAFGRKPPAKKKRPPRRRRRSG